MTDATPELVELDVPVDPHYHHSVSIGLAGEKPSRLVLEEPIADPFATTMVDISTKDLLAYWWASRRRKKPLRIQTSVGGDWDAMKHVTEVRPLHAKLPADQAAERVVAEAFATEPDEFSLRRRRDEPHTLWYWVDDASDIPAPFASSFDTADEAEAAAVSLVQNDLRNCERMEVESKLAWVKVFRSDNENYQTWHYERGGPIPARPGQVDER